MTRPGLQFERELWGGGADVVVGIDEVGRGAWAGPLVVGAAALTAEGHPPLPQELRDSKQLRPAVRERLFDEVAAACAAWAVGKATAAECDEMGMSAAQRLAAARALEALELRADAVLLDGRWDFVSPPSGTASAGGESVRAAVQASDRPTPPGAASADGEPVRAAVRTSDRPTLPGAASADGEPVRATVRTVVGGDARCASIAAASVLAKVWRDRAMVAAAPHYPAYDFDRNKGYPCPRHRAALAAWGPSAIHRISWAFMDHLPGSAGVQLRLDDAR